MKNSADQGGCFPQRPTAEVDYTLRDLQNSSYPTKAEFNNCFIIHSKYFFLRKGVLPLRYLFFSSPNNSLYNTTLSPGFLGQRFNNLRRAVLLTSLIQYGKDFDVISSIIVGRLHFWRHWFNMAKILSKLILVSSSWLWWIMRVV